MAEVSHETLLTKAAILNGRNQAQRIRVEELGGELEIHPLSAGQYSQVEAIRAAGTKISGRPVMGSDGQVDRKATSENLSFDIDLEKTARADFEADATAVAFSLSSPGGERWTVDEVMAIPSPEAVTKIAKAIYGISRVEPKQIEQVHSFRDKSGGSKPRHSPHDRNAVGG